jgi:hypothetical protein
MPITEAMSFTNKKGFIHKTPVVRRWAPIAHTCNPSYSEGRDQEDYGSKPAQANSS